MGEPQGIGELIKQSPLPEWTEPPKWILRNQARLSEEVSPSVKEVFRGVDKMGIFPKYQPCTFENFYSTPGTEKGRRICENWAKNPEGFLFLSGSTGTGKTHLAVATLKACCARNKRFASANRILLSLQDTFHKGAGARKDVMNSYLSPTILVMDDLGAEKTKDEPSLWAINVFYTIVDERDCFLRPTILTSNYGFADLAKNFSDRVASRIGRAVYLEGEDWRLTKGAPVPQINLTQGK